MTTVPVEVMLMAQDTTGRACAGEPDFEQRCRKAMRSVIDGHWMVGDRGPKGEDLCFRGAIAGVMLDPLTTEQEKSDIEFTMRQLQALSGLLNGLPMDITKMANQVKDRKPLPLMKWWHELHEETKTGQGS